MNETSKPTLTIRHPNGNGTGTALRLAICPATSESEGGLTLELASQSSVTPTEFKWSDAIKVRLSFDDICEILNVLRGYCESIQDGKGLYLKNGDGRLVVRLEHTIMPMPGYLLTICTVDVRKISIHITATEAIGIEAAISASMGRIAFG